ncbi:uncharacterized protein CANTADRAFT_4819 [Suhomyces tanzawaensis NRRL Y-17324]|uniref:G-patch domain-containing protein n=1 Tax=Suhomyces tanzawaensis NRRL Y-17324 TaxID=984487 RepID=A0A1E4SMV6_9ASCO|nr:uncharacterized protein CANTADRAFT_4819 [Suhomyces tanzawaensis NRRL Y-17324]ODV80818.1 hypothetical protein CANTADRAFT_4819 [Suhomyces tanzawaensis NRRL Y-17324]
MAYGGGLAFTKGAGSSKDDASAGSPPSTVKNGGSMRMAAFHDEYEDELDEEEDNAEEEVTQRTSMSQPSWLNPSQSSNIQKYGIGAKLMMKMGYQEGKGLGVKNEGIVQPIETKLLPKGLGVGAFSTHEQEVKLDVDSSDDEDKAPKVSLFEIIEELQGKGIDVPLKYKILSDEKDRRDDEELRKAFAKLTRISQEWTEADTLEQFLNYQLEAGTKTAEKNKRDLESAERVLSLLQSKAVSQMLEIDDATESIEATTTILTSLVSEPYRDFTSIKSVFASIVGSCLPKLFQGDIESTSNENSLLITTLSSWSFLYRELTITTDNSMDPFDSVVYCALSEKMQQFLASKEPDEEHLIDNLNLLQTWLHAPIFVNPEVAIQVKFTREVISPYFTTQIEKWYPDKRYAFSPTFIIDFILLLCPENAIEFQEVLQLILQKYLRFVDIGSDKSLWRVTDTEMVRSELGTLMEVWSKVFDQYLGPEKFYNIKDVLTSSLLEFLNSWTIGEEKDLQRVLQIGASGIMGQNDFEIILQFQVFNPWVSTLGTKCKENKIQVQEYFRRWFDLWSKSHWKQHPLVLWYFNTALDHIETSAPMILPTLMGSSAPTTNEIRKFIDREVTEAASTINVNGIPSYKLVTSFKDVVSAYCTSHGFLFSSTNEFHPTLGHPLHRIQLASFKAWAFIHEDVLWICRSYDGDYTPISLEQLE